MQEAEKNHELVSALADGRLRGEEFARTVEWIDQDDEARATWHAYHVVGDVLRSGTAMTGTRDADFMRRVSRRLAQEPAPVRSLDATNVIAGYAISTATGGPKTSEIGSANDKNSGWKWGAVAASLAALSVLAWHSVGGSGDPQQLAQVPVQAVKPEAALPQAVVGAAPQRMIRDPQLDALLVAHRQSGGVSAFQMPAGFLRNATFEGATP